MKRIITAAAAALIVAFSAVPVFAGTSVNSPVATTAPTPSTPSDPTSPKTGSADFAIYSVIALSVAACGAASVVLAKSKK